MVIKRRRIHENNGEDMDRVQAELCYTFGSMDTYNYLIRTRNSQHVVKEIAKGQTKPC